MKEGHPLPDVWHCSPIYRIHVTGEEDNRLLHMREMMRTVLGKAVRRGATSLAASAR